MSTVASLDEIWREVPGYPEYAVSTMGKVKRIVGGPGKVAGLVLKQHKSHNGYLFVTLSKGGNAKQFRVNRLVLSVFVGEPPIGMESSHLDGDKLNNRIGNLIWESTQDNNARRKMHGTSKGALNGRSKLRNEDVLEIRKRYASEKTSYTALAKEYGVSFGLIGHIITGRQWSHVGVQA